MHPAFKDGPQGFWASAWLVFVIIGVFIAVALTAVWFSVIDLGEKLLPRLVRPKKVDERTAHMMAQVEAEKKNKYTPE